MLNIKHLPPYFCIGEYVPKRFWSDENTPDDGYTGFVLDIKNSDDEAIFECIELFSNNLTGFDAVTAVPSSKISGTSGIQRVAQGIARASSVTDATSCLRRHQSISSHHEGHRAIDVHLQSICLEHPELIEGKSVLLIDDVRTTGGSIDACRQRLEEASPNLIRAVALSQTCGSDNEDFFDRYQDTFMEIHTDYKEQKDVLDVCCDIEEEALENLRRFVYGDS